MRALITCERCGNKYRVMVAGPTRLVCQACNCDTVRINYGDEEIVRVKCHTCHKFFVFPCREPVSVYHDAPNCKSYYLVLDPSDFILPGVKEKMVLEEKPPEIPAELITIIILAWNNYGITETCLQSIRKHTKRPIQIILVDNGSVEDLSGLKRHIDRKNDILLTNSENRGFAYGNNQALKLALGEYVLFINNDIVVKEDGWLDGMVAGLKNYDLIGPTPRKVEPCHDTQVFVFNGDAPSVQGKYSYLEGWCLFGRRILFNEMDGFDNQFNPAYAEDVDLCFRLKERGKKLGVVDIPVKHLGQKSSAQLRNIDPDRSSLSNKKLYQKWEMGESHRMLIRRLGAVGDVLYTTPILEALKEKHPEFKIFYETNCPQLIAGNQKIESLIRDSTYGSFDIVYDLLYEIDPEKNLVDVMAKQAEVKVTNRRPVIYGDFSDVKVPKKPYVVFHTGRSWVNREWPVSRFSTVAKWVMDKGFKVVEIGNGLTQPMSAKNVLRRLNLSWHEVIGLIKLAQFFVGLDSGPSVIAKAFNVPAFLTYGCVDPKTRFVDSIEFPLVDESLKCFGCRNKTSATFVKCKTKTLACLKNVTVDYVVSRIEEGMNV